MLAPGDASRIERHLELEPGGLDDRLLASPGAKVMQAATRRVFRIGTIVPARKPDGSCVFLHGGLCSIHEVAPYGCAYFDAHMSAREGDKRSAAGLREIQQDLAYQARWQRLKRNGRVAVAPEQLRKRFNEEC